MLLWFGGTALCVNLQAVALAKLGLEPRVTLLILSKKLLEVGIGVWVLDRHLRPWYPLLPERGLFRYTPSLEAVGAGFGAFAAEFALLFVVGMVVALYPSSLAAAAVAQIKRVRGGSRPLQRLASMQAEALHSPAYLAAYFALMLFIGPVWEETLFRGFLLTSLAKHAPTWAAILLSSLAFAAAHMDRNPVRLFLLFCTGCLNGHAYTRTGSLAAPIVAHAANNLLCMAGTIARLLSRAR